eukprot:scaffold43885_cov61-Phaeocystis_antarctica.AAC.3
MAVKSCRPSALMSRPPTTLAMTPETATPVKSCDTCGMVSCHCVSAKTCSVSPMKMGRRVSTESSASRLMARDMKKSRVKANGLNERTSKGSRSSSESDSRTRAAIPKPSSEIREEMP